MSPPMRKQLDLICNRFHVSDGSRLKLVDFFNKIEWKEPIGQDAEEFSALVEESVGFGPESAVLRANLSSLLVPFSWETAHSERMGDLRPNYI